MQGDGAALPFVGDLDFQAQDVAELPLKRSDIGIELVPPGPERSQPPEHDPC